MNTQLRASVERLSLSGRNTVGVYYPEGYEPDRNVSSINRVRAVRIGESLMDYNLVPIQFIEPDFVADPRVDGLIYDMLISRTFAEPRNGVSEVYAGPGCEIDGSQPFFRTDRVGLWQEAA